MYDYKEYDISLLISSIIKNLSNYNELIDSVNIETINEESSQDSIEQWDSMKHLDLIVALEEEFGVDIPIEEVGNMTNFKYIKLIIEEQLA